MNTHWSKHQQMPNYTIYWVPLSFDIVQQFQVRELNDFIIMRSKPAIMISGFDYILEHLLSLIWQTYDVDNSIGMFDRIVL